MNSFSFTFLAVDFMSPFMRKQIFRDIFNVWKSLKDLNYIWFFWYFRLFAALVRARFRSDLLRRGWVWRRWLSDRGMFPHEPVCVRFPGSPFSRNNRGAFNKRATAFWSRVRNLNFVNASHIITGSNINKWVRLNHWNDWPGVCNSSCFMCNVQTHPPTHY